MKYYHLEYVTDCGKWCSACYIFLGDDQLSSQQLMRFKNIYYLDHIRLTSISKREADVFIVAGASVFNLWSGIQVLDEELIANNVKKFLSTSSFYAEQKGNGEFMSNFDTPRLLLEIKVDNKWVATKIYCDYLSVRSFLNHLPHIAKRMNVEVYDARVKYLSTDEMIADAKQAVYRNSANKPKTTKPQENS